MSNLWTYRQGTDLNGQDLVGYDVEAIDGGIGKIDAATQQTDTSHVVVDTGWWIFDKKRLIPAGAIATVDHEAQQVSVQMTKDQIKSAPDFDESLDLDAENRKAYEEYYRPFGW
jgi:hypothetical protein